MALLPRRHPQKDFFVLDIADVVPKDDTASMEHPLFSLATKPDRRVLTYGGELNKITIKPSGDGLPTIFDKDILIFCISQLMHRKNQGLPIGNRVRFSARELMIATNRPTGGAEYKRLSDAFHRLLGTTFQTDIVTGKTKESRFFSLIDSGSGFVMQSEGKWRLDFCEVVLSDWLMRAIEGSEVLTISEDYFRLRRPLERRIYEIARKHCGHQKRWNIGLENLQLKTGSSAPLKKFRHNLRQIIEDDHTPDYRLELTDTDQVIFRPRKGLKNPDASLLLISAGAEEKARAIAREKGWDYHALEREWRDFARSKEPPRDADAAFLGFCKNKGKLR
jgi:plasmid replication initiation protein